METPSFAHKSELISILSKIFMMKGRFVDQSRTFAPLFCWLKIDHYVFSTAHILTFANLLRLAQFENKNIYKQQG